MAAPQLNKKKFWIVKPKEGRNEIWNPRFDPPEGVTYWRGTNASLSLSGDETRRNAYSMKVLVALAVPVEVAITMRIGCPATPFTSQLNVYLRPLVTFNPRL